MLRIDNVDCTRLVPNWDRIYLRRSSQSGAHGQSSARPAGLLQEPDQDETSSKTYLFCNCLRAALSWIRGQNVPRDRRCSHPYPADRLRRGLLRFPPPGPFPCQGALGAAAAATPAIPGPKCRLAWQPRVPSGGSGRPTPAPPQLDEQNARRVRTIMASADGRISSRSSVAP